MDGSDGNNQGPAPAGPHVGCGDGPVPRWWAYIFVVTIVWSVVYWLV